MITRPMLAKRVKDPATLRFPLLATPKLDGVRCLIIDGQPLSRAFKPIRNAHIANLLSQLPSGLDGELVLAGADFSDSQSAVMNSRGQPDFRYAVFDWVDGDLEEPYEQRTARIPSLTQSFIQPILPTIVTTMDELGAYEANAISQGYEGVMLRSLYSPYECKRSAYMVKLKRYQDGEATIVGFQEGKQNFNPVVPNRWGYARRPGGSALKLPKGALGSLHVVDIRTGVRFRVGTGLDDDLRQRIWDNQADYLGKLITYKYQGVGSKDKPRFPSFIGFRHIEDTDAN